MNVPNVFDYSDYRSYLKGFFLSKKNLNPSFSYQVWARQMGLKNNTSLLKVVHGQRGAGPLLRKKLHRYFQFNPKEADYFETLVLLSKHGNKPANLKDLFEKIKAIQPRNNAMLLSKDEFENIAHWWNYAIRQLTKLKDFNESITWIQSRLNFPVSKKEISRSLNVLVKGGFLIRDTLSKRLITGPSSISSTNDFKLEALRQFHEETLVNAKASIRKTDVLERQISGVTFAIKKKNLPKAKHCLVEFQAAFSDKFEAASGDGDEVYQLEMAFFPLTQSKKTQAAKGINHENTNT